MKTRLFPFLALPTVTLLFAIFAGAQNHSTDAQLSGTLTDSSGAGIPEVHVTARLEGAAPSQVWRCNSATDGTYRLSVPPGRYRITFERAPFIARDFSLELAAARPHELNLTLQLEPLSSSVIVTAQAEPTLADLTTAPVSVITKADIDERQVVALAEALAFTTGVALGRTGREGGSASIFLNGGNSNFTKVLVDGAPINPPGGAVDFSSLTLDNIDKVEVVRGAESAIYGSDAVSGVIQLFTHRGETRIPEFSAYAEGGSYGSARGGAQLSGLLGAFDYALAGSYLQTGGQGPDDDFLDRTLSGNLGYRLSDNNNLRLTLRNNDSIAGVPGQTVFTPPNLDQRYTQHLFSSSARWDFSTGAHWRQQISGAESYTWQGNFNPVQSFFASDPAVFCPQSNPAAVATAEFCDFPGSSKFQYNRSSLTAQTSFVLKNFAATAGYGYEIENAFLTSINVPHARRNNQASYLDFRYRPHPRASLNVGARAEANQFFGTRVVPRAGASLVLFYGKGFRGDSLLRAFYAEGIKEPRFDQILGDNFGDFGNPSLKPEASNTWTLGIEQKFLRDRIRLDANYFSSRFYNIVSFEFCVAAPTPTNPLANSCGVTLPGNPVNFGYFFNTDLARARGLNLSGQARLAHWLRAEGNYTYDDSLVIKSPNAFDPSELPGNRLIRRPLNSGSLALNAGLRRLNITLAGYFTGVRTDSDFLGLGLTRNPGYARFDFSGSYSVGHGVTVYARAANLLDKQYQDALGYPALGRDMRAGVKYTFNGRN